MAKPKRCIAETCVNVAKIEPTTYRCELRHGHDGGHEHKHPTTGRTLTWFGKPAKVDKSQRYRFGAWIESNP